MKNSLSDFSMGSIALFAGIGYLIIFITGIFSNFFILENLIVWENASETAANILSSESLYRIGIFSFTIMVIFDAFLVWALYLLLNPVNQKLSLLSAWMRLMNVAIFTVALVYLIQVLNLLTGDEFLNSLGTEHLNANVLLLLDTFNSTWLLGLVFFGLHLLVLGYLIVKSHFIPSFIGILLFIASFGYLADSFANFLLSSYDQYQQMFTVIVVIPGIIGELSFTFWLIFKGSKLNLENLQP